MRNYVQCELCKEDTGSMMETVEYWADVPVYVIARDLRKLDYDWDYANVYDPIYDKTLATIEMIPATYMIYDPCKREYVTCSVDAYMRDDVKAASIYFLSYEAQGPDEVDCHFVAVEAGGLVATPSDWQRPVSFDDFDNVDWGGWHPVNPVEDDDNDWFEHHHIG